MDRYTNAGRTFTVADAGPREAPEDRTVVLLHGFPQTAEAWAGVTPRLNAQGLRTLAPDTGGVSDGARAHGRRDYRIDRLADDVVGLLDAAGVGSAHLVGHDWGGATAWAMASLHPARVRSLTILSTPHPAAMAWAMTHSNQGLKSWYMLAMNVPVIPERLLRHGMRRSGMSSLNLPESHERAYVDAMTRPGALRRAIGPYRGLTLRPMTDAGAARPIAVPTTFVWGRDDPYLGREAAERTSRHCYGDYRFVEVDGDHWLPEKHPALVAREVLARVAGSEAS